jgi:hypothetical protein
MYKPYPHAPTYGTPARGVFLSAQNLESWRAFLIDFNDFGALARIHLLYLWTIFYLDFTFCMAMECVGLDWKGLEVVHLAEWHGGREGRKEGRKEGRMNE